eukprot:6084677-Prymnesium_polylepis.1
MSSLYSARSPSAAGSESEASSSCSARISACRDSDGERESEVVAQRAKKAGAAALRRGGRSVRCYAPPDRSSLR